MPLAEMMILRDLMDNRKEQLSELSRKVQKSLDETKKSCNELVNSGLIEIVGKEYMLLLVLIFIWMRKHHICILISSLGYLVAREDWRQRQVLRRHLLPEDL